MISVAESTAEVVARKPRRQPSKTTARPLDQRKKIGVYLSSDAYRKLGAESLMSGDDWGVIIDRLIRENLKRFIISDRAKAAAEVMSNESVQAA